MHVFKSLLIAFSMYSGIPVPQFEWKEEDMKYTYCFFPWIGAVIGGCIFLWHYLCGRFEVNPLCYTLIGTGIPILITGGFHVDGFMDTMDAFHSYRPKEKKLEILKDSHIGAFAVIMLVVYILIYAGAFSQVYDERILVVVCAGFFLSRCLSGIGAVSFPKAKKEGMLNLFADSAEKKIVKISLYVQSLACIGFMVVQSVLAGIVITLAALLSLGYYGRRCRRELGGITGDTAGYFVLLCEGCVIVAAALLSIIGI